MSGSDLRKTAADRTGSNGPLDLIDERVVTTGVQQDKPQFLCTFGRAHCLLQPDSLELNVTIRNKFGIYRNQIIYTSYLHSVTGIVNHRPIRIIRLLGEIP